jgi:hypothetical protein
LPNRGVPLDDEFVAGRALPMAFVIY